MQCAIFDVISQELSHPVGLPGRCGCADATAYLCMWVFNGDYFFFLWLLLLLSRRAVWTSVMLFRESLLCLTPVSAFDWWLVIGVVTSHSLVVRNSLLAVIRQMVWARPGISASWFWWGCILTAGNHPQPGIISSNSIRHIVTWLSK